MLAPAAVLILKHRAYSCQAVDQEDVLSSWLRTLANSAWNSTSSNSGRVTTLNVGQSLFFVMIQWLLGSCLQSTHVLQEHVVIVS